MAQEYLPYVGNIALIVCTITCLVITASLWRKDSQSRSAKNYPAKFLGTSAGFIGLYFLFLLMYEVILVQDVIIFCSHLSWVLGSLGMTFLYFTFQVIVNSSAWLDDRRRYMIPLLVLLVYSICIFAIPNSVSPVDLVPSKTRPAPWVLVGFGIGVFYYMGSSFYNLIFRGIAKVTGSSRRNMVLMLVGLVISCAGLILAFFGSLTEDLVFDILFYCLFATGTLLLGISVIHKKTE